MCMGRRRPRRRHLLSFRTDFKRGRTTLHHLLVFNPTLQHAHGGLHVARPQVEAEFNVQHSDKSRRPKPFSLESIQPRRLGRPLSSSSPNLKELAVHVTHHTSRYIYCGVRRRGVLRHAERQSDDVSKGSCAHCRRLTLPAPLGSS